MVCCKDFIINPKNPLIVDGKPRLEPLTYTSSYRMNVIRHVLIDSPCEGSTTLSSSLSTFSIDSFIDEKHISPQF